MIIDKKQKNVRRRKFVKTIKDEFFMRDKKTKVNELNKLICGL